MNELSRRQFIVLSTATAAACACGSGGFCSNALAAEEARQINVGELKSFDKEGVVTTFAKSDRVLVVRQGEKIFALTAACSHKGGVVKLVDGDLRCPNHGARFDLAGKVTKGPATEALEHLGISISAQGQVIVDTGKRFPEAKWDDSAAWVKASK